MGEKGGIVTRQWFAVGFCLLLVFVSGSYAHTVELVSNSCGVVECEAVLRVIPDRDITLSSAQNRDYRFDYYIEKGNLKSVAYEVGEEQSKTVYGTKLSCHKVEVPDLNKGGTVLVDKCESVTDYSKPRVETTVSWQPGFFGKAMDSGKTYYIRITGEIAKPYIGQFRADWVLTFDKVEYKKWAWWNAAWSYRRPIFLPPVDIDKNTTIEIPIDFTDANYSGKVLASLNDVRVFDDNQGTELDRICVPGASGKCWYRMPNPMHATQTAEQISTYYIYYDNAGAGAPPDLNVEMTWVEDFEVSALTGWNDVSDATLDTTISRFGATSLKVKTDNLWKGITKLGSLADGNSDYNYSLWMRADDVTVSAGWSVREPSQGEYICYMGINSAYGGNFWYADAGNDIDTGVTAAPDTWYKTVAHVNDSSNVCTYSFYAADGKTLLASGFGRSQLGSNGSTITRLHLWAGTSPIKYSYFDNIYDKPALTGSGFGAEEEPETAARVDLNIWRVEGYDVIQQQFPTFNYDYDGNLTIDFNVFNVDNNAMTVDINYSTSPTQGTGTVIVNDLNLSSFVCTNAQLWNVYDTNCSWDWNILGVADNNYYILIDLNGGGPASTVFEALGKTLHIQSNTLRLGVFDENTGAPLISTTVTFNGIEYSVGVDGHIGISVARLAAGTYSAEIQEDGNYDSRFFEFDINSTMGVVDVNVFMLRDVNGQDVSFKFYGTDGATVLANKRIYVLHDSNIVSIRSTNAGGETSFFLSPDGNYVFDIISGTATTRYYPVLVTVNIPKNESSLVGITPYDITLSGLGWGQGLGQTTAAAFHIFPNTVSHYVFDVNAGGDYFNRRYYVALRGNPKTYTLQPYLVRQDDGLASVIAVRNSFTAGGIPNILIVSKKNISGSLTIVEQVNTDSAGEALMSFITNDTYYLYFYYNSVLKADAELRPTSATYQFYLDLGIFEIPEPVYIAFDVNFMPFGGIAWWHAADHNIDLNQSIVAISGVMATVQVIVENGTTEVYNETFDMNAATNTAFFVQQDFNGWLLNRVKPLKVRLIITTTGGYQYTETKSYYIQSSFATTGASLWIALGGFPLMFGATPSEYQPAMTIIALFVAILACGAAAAVVTTDLSGVTFIGMAVLGLFVFLGWVPMVPYVIACVAAFSIYVITRRF